MPFTVTADLELGERIAPYMAGNVADVEIREGSVPADIGGESSGIAYQIRPGKMLLEIPDGTRFLIENGERIIYSRGESSTDKDIALFLLGSAWGALCYQRGLIPLHASGVAVNGEVHAFTGTSGAGKSTLTAGLSSRGLEFFTDDVLIFDPAAEQKGAYCYAGQKDLKLWGDALALTGATSMGRVRDGVDIDKHFARPGQTAQATAGPLTHLYILQRKNEDEEPRFSTRPVTGHHALRHLMTSLYRPRYAETLMGRKMIFQGLKKLVETVRVSEFNRVFLEQYFDDSVTFISELLKGEVRS